MLSRRPLRLGGLWLILALAGVGVLGRDGYLQLKGLVATELVDAALAAHLTDGLDHSPWQWADFQPVARLLVPRLGVSRAVLAGSTNQTMAFGLAHVGGTAQPGQNDNMVLAGHRDSWARFMSGLRPGDLLVVEFAEGQRSYRVRDAVVVDQSQTEVLAQGGGAQLTLVTCWPFGGLLPSPDRLVVTAAPVIGGIRPPIVQ